MPNFPEFNDHISDIYGAGLTVNKSNEVSSTLNVAYLDLSISVSSGRFIVKVYCKTDDFNFQVVTMPFLESNIADSICYNVYFGQVLRFLRICTLQEDFVESFFR